MSTQKQEDKGVSLKEQRDAIQHYAERNGLQISEWFEETLTAAKRGRPQFDAVLKGLQRGRAKGLIIHKIDRSARNLRDWSDLGDLIDAGVAVHFANESLDLHSRGGRLSADIQAIVAADYIRNLREEILKGIRGRLKDGLYPFAAPLGYIDKGAGQAKAVDPLRAPLVRQAFELYASGRFTLMTLAHEMHRRGLRNRSGNRVDHNGVSRILNNTFHAGLTRLKSRGESYVGRHQPIVPMALFKRVQARLSGKHHVEGWKHDYLFRGLFRCEHCKRCLIGEKQKGHIYYRCHEKGCPSRSFREEVLEAAVLGAVPPIAGAAAWRANLLTHIEYVQSRELDNVLQRSTQLQARLAALRSRETKLVDALLDGVLDKETFETRKSRLLEERREIEDALRAKEPDAEAVRSFIAETLELVSTAQQSFRLADKASQREMVLRLSSNRTVAGKKVLVEPSIPIASIAKRDPFSKGVPSNDRNRTMKAIAERLLNWATHELHQRRGTSG